MQAYLVCKQLHPDLIVFNSSLYSVSFLPPHTAPVFFCTTSPVQPTTSERSLVVTCLRLQLIFESNPNYPSADSAESEMVCESTHGTEKSSLKRLQITISFAGVRCAYLKCPPRPDSLHIREETCLKKTKSWMVSIWLSEKSVKASTG